MAETPADIILHPVRMRIVTTLSGRHLTTQQIGLALPEVAQATLYRHLSRLVKGDVVTVVAQRPVRGGAEKVYALAGGGAPVRLDVSGMTRDDWEHGFAAFTASLLGQFGVYIRQEQANPITDGLSFRTTPLYLSDAEMTQLGADLLAAATPFLSYGPSSERRRRLFSTVLVPDADIPDGDLAHTGEF